MICKQKEVNGEGVFKIQFFLKETLVKMASFGLLLPLLIVASSWVVQVQPSPLNLDLFKDLLVLTAENLTSIERSSKDQEVQFQLWTKSNPLNPERLSFMRRRSLFTNFDKNKPTKIIIHGWQGSGEVHYALEMKNALVPRYDMNVITVDWSRHGSKSYNYISSSRRVKEVAELVALFIDDLATNRGVPPSKLHVLGHSLGAHVAGTAGKLVKTGKIARITGFDPAGVFYKEAHDDRLSPESAEFVDVIHTSTNILGHEMKMGHVDFYPNGGKAPQPGCGFLDRLAGHCSHQRAHLYYIEALDRATGFPAVMCNSWKEFQEDKCDIIKVNYLGEHTRQNLPGKFFMATNDKSPFSKGMTWI